MRGTLCHKPSLTAALKAVNTTSRIEPRSTSVTELPARLMSEAIHGRSRWPMTKGTNGTGMR